MDDGTTSAGSRDGGFRNLTSRAALPKAHPAGINVQAPNHARVYDALLGGKDNFKADRELVDRLADHVPDLADYARVHRAWLLRVVRWLTKEVGIDQYLDCGSGLPTVENTHEVAQQINPDARVVYLDNDPVVVAHGKFILEDGHTSQMVEADLTRPADVLQHPVVREHLDFDRPIGLMQCATIHQISDGDLARRVMAEYIEGLPSGSYVAMTHMYVAGEDDADYNEIQRAVQEDAQRGIRGYEGTARTRTEIEALFGGLELAPPGLVFLADWWPEGPRVKPLTAMEKILLSGVGRKP